MVISEVRPKVEDVKFENAAVGDLSVRGRLTTENGSIYCVAINTKNADKQFHKMLKKPYNKNKK